MNFRIETSIIKPAATPVVKAAAIEEVKGESAAATDLWDPKESKDSNDPIKELKSQISAKVNELLPNSKVFNRFRVMLHQGNSAKQVEGKYKNKIIIKIKMIRNIFAKFPTENTFPLNFQVGP